MKTQSIPRLELLGATILVRLAKTVQNALPQELKTVFWVDSLTVLGWIKNTKPWKQYVVSRIQEIREDTSQSWNFCPGQHNPADIPSRGMTASELVVNSKWWKGPKFLYNLKTEWSRKQHSYYETENATKEIIKNPPTTTHVLTTSASGFFSEWRTSNH